MRPSPAPPRPVRRALPLSTIAAVLAVGVSVVAALAVIIAPVFVGYQTRSR